MTVVAPPRPPAGRLGVLGQIAAQRRTDVLTELGDASFRAMRRDARGAAPARPFAERLAASGLHVIAEVKRASPSAGRLAPAGLDIAAQARAYAAGGATAISVLCEGPHFGGSLDDLRVVREAVALPVLAKEFVVDPRQLPQLRAAGADAVLLLAALHPAARLGRLVWQALDLGLEPLVEAHDERELERALRTPARVIGLNARDLRTLAVDPERAVALVGRVPGDRVVVAESGIRDADAVRDLRALGVDAVLVGEALMRAPHPEAMVRSLVEAGAVPDDAAAAARAPLVKICGVTDEAGLLAAVRAGADAVGLNVVPGTPRCLDVREAAALAGLLRASRTGPTPRLVAVTADASPADLARIVEALDPGIVQCSGHEPAGVVATVRRPVWKTVHLDRAPGTPATGQPDPLEAVPGIVAEVSTWLAMPPVEHVLLDTAGGPHAGGTGVAVDRRVAAAVAREVPVVLAGGLDPATVGEAVLAVPAIGVDVASGTDLPRRPGHRPRKDPFRVALFIKRARAARFDRPTVAARPTPVAAGLLDVDARGRWGTDRAFGGRYVPETLVTALEQLEAAWAAVREEPRYWAQLRELGQRYVGRPSALYRADRLAAALARRVGRDAGSLHLWLKREDLNHTGAHKINNALGQALLTRRLGKSRVIAETGAGQHGVATATACALLDLPCVVYMGAQDIRRQAPNVLRMRALGAQVVPVTSGSATLKDAVNEAMRDWVTNVATTHYVLGSAVGPHPYPLIVRDLQRVIGDEAAEQLLEVEGRLPDVAIACLGGGSNGLGLLSRFIGEPAVRLVGVEAAGEGLATGRHAAALAGGSPGILHGSRSYMLQDGDGQVVEAVSLSAGLDYPGIGPQLSALFAAGRLEVLAATDAEALDGLRLLTRTEGIIPALEAAHAIAALPRLLAGGVGRPALADGAVVLLGLS
ncbi:MAG TPA: tryptophan synthase subunit beta, partial [Candidatus Baltobacteraceae bacterium]|nr:tryptophan synthase subunit beta [Candidatus Baltobacteraceae bacterium]